jgi:formate hydrogenlyase subunit 6/NADH:ubiquinone oxidoreductase subunit I
MITIEHAGCIFCVGCSSVCPANAIEAVGTRMKHYPEKCIDCGLCAKVCPANVITLHKGVKDCGQLKAGAAHAAKGAGK